MHHTTFEANQVLTSSQAEREGRLPDAAATTGPNASSATLAEDHLPASTAEERLSWQSGGVHRHIATWQRGGSWPFLWNLPNFQSPKCSLVWQARNWRALLCTSS